MKVLSVLPAVALLLVLVGCSKKEAAGPAEGDAGATNAAEQAEQPAEAPAEAPVETPTESVAEMAPETLEGIEQSAASADVSSVSQSLQSADYDAAADTLAAAGKAKMTPEQQAAYNAQLYRTLDALRQKAETDARAKEAYERAGRKLMGR